MFTIVHVRKHQRALWFRHGDFHRLLHPGDHFVWTGLFNGDRDKFELADTLKTRFEHPMLDVLVDEPELRQELIVVDLCDAERALVWRDERLMTLLGPGRHAFWMAPARVQVERFRVEAFRFEHPRMQAILAHPFAQAFLEGVRVDSTEQVLLWRDGVLAETLGQGLHVFWKGAGVIRWKQVDLREQVADVAGQEIMTADKVTLRVNLLVTYQVADPTKAATAVADAGQALYRDAQMVLRAAVGTRTLDALLTDKESIGMGVRESLANRTKAYGLVVKSVGLRDIVLPGDMKTLLNQVIAATKEAEANLIRRREETAAARSQANTARLLAENPQLARMKELELLQGILAGSNATFVFGQGELVEQVRGLVASHAGNGRA
jgi:regulator of protease activity HflC (stomatin/prohibitin superfamily)